MNKILMLNLLLDFLDNVSSDDQEDGDLEEEEQEVGLEVTLQGINNGKQVTLPVSLPSDPKRAERVLRKHFADDVSLISFVLHHHFPDKYLFYRVSALEEEIFLGLEFFSSVVPAFDLPFRRIGKLGFERYLRLNE